MDATGAGGSSILGLVFFVLMIGLAWLPWIWWERRRTRILMEWAASQGMEFLGWRVPMALPMLPWWRFGFWRREKNCILGRRGEFDVFCCDYTNRGGRRSKHGSIVGIRAVVRDTAALKQSDMYVATGNGWTFVLTAAMMWSYRLDPVEIEEMWDHMRSVTREQDVADCVVRSRMPDGVGGGIVIRPRRMVVERTEAQG